MSKVELIFNQLNYFEFSNTVAALRNVTFFLPTVKRQLTIESNSNYQPKMNRIQTQRSSINGKTTKYTYQSIDAYQVKTKNID